MQQGLPFYRSKTFHRKKIMVMFTAVFLALLFLMGRLVYLMVFCSEYYGQKAQNLHERERDIKASRGKILDANGMVLATNKSVCTISVIHSQIEDEEAVVKALVKELGLSEEAVRKRVEKVSSIERVKTNVPKETGDKIRAYKLAGIKVDEDYKRYYPYDTLASKVLGFTGGDNQGIVGLEVKYDSYLQGTNGKILTLTDARGIEIENAGETRLEPVNGYDLNISMDYNIQLYCEQAAEKTYIKKDAKYVSVIVMNPSNGEILAMVNYPEFHLNDPFTLTEEVNVPAEKKQDLLNQMWRNQCISDTYEPGSTFKIITDDELKVDDINVNQYEYVSSNNYKYKTDENNVTTNLVDSYTSSIELHYILTDEEKAEIQEALDNNEVTKEEVDEYYASLNKTLNSLTTHYEYDNAGRITKIFTDGELSALYQYDEAGQLTEEIDENGATQYTYDAGGNITTKIHYDNVEYDDKNDDFILGEATKVTNYTYDNDEWSDLLTSVDGTEIQYDDMGNPLNYKGTDYYNETINASLTWNGRLLTSLVLDENSGLAENDKYDYSYNADGLRTEKRRYKLNNDKSSYYLYQLDEYVWENNILKGYKISYPGLADSNSYIVFPLYDDNNEIIGVSYKIILNDSSSSSSSDSNATENVLYFVKDAQGNIQKMVDQINDYEFIYKYDAYGKLISFTIPKEETKINNILRNGADL